MSLISVLKKKSNKYLFTTPSHSGKLCIFHKFYQWYRSDISETDTHNPRQALLKAEEKASKIYKTKFTKFLTNGSTSGVIAAIIASQAKRILIWDNAHPCHANGAELAGCEIFKYELKKDVTTGVYRAITPNETENLLLKTKADCIVITSPTYEGFVADIEQIAKICKKYSAKLIVDEAHGALYPFSDLLPISAVENADYTIQSLHKTAGGLNPTALLHSNDNNPETALAKITTTSPSYPLLATIEANINYLNSKKGRNKINNLISEINKLNIPKLNDDITKVLIKKDNMSGYELSEILYHKYGIEDEKTNDISTMLLCGIGTDKRKLIKLRHALKNLGI